MPAPSPYSRPYILALDTANEVIAVGVGKALEGARIETIATFELPAHRASNTKLLGCVEDVLAGAGVSKDEIGCVACGRGPGSFTGVRIAMATAKGIASALGTSLVGVSTLDAIAWAVQQAGERGQLLVAADAMRHEVYPVRYALTDAGIERLQPDRVLKAELAADEADGGDLLIAGDALFKYAELFEAKGRFASEALWTPTGTGLLLALQDAWGSSAVDIFDASAYDPAFALPVYTRLSDAEENERARLASQEARDLVSGVQGAGIAYQPLERRYVPAVALMEQATMGTDAWSEALLEDELARKDRSWWIALQDGELIGYAGGLVACGELQILKVAVSPDCRRKGIARELVARVAADARNLGAESATLEVRASNDGAQAFYEALGLESQGARPGYYSDREDALIMSGPLPHGAGDIAGMTLQVDAAIEGAQVHLAADTDELATVARPLIFAIESSCDETAAAIIDGNGTLIADVVASQIDFHARFGGVVPEIASRKHIEAICGVCSECFEVAAERLGCAALGWQDMDAVAATYAPGLVGALVVGVAFAKGAAWGAGKPFIGVNHLEGHLYANKLADEGMEPPAVASLVSGGNTMLVHMKAWGDYEILGTTIDDAVGEAFDKVAKALGLGYPGGPVISRYAKDGDPDAIAFPRAMLHSGDYRFSLSGLKTAVITYINQERAEGRELNIPDICASFQQAVIDVQVAKARTALREMGAPLFCLGGGVAANAELRRAYETVCAEEGVRLLMPPLRSCGDNAGMIALVALDRYRAGRFFDLSADAYAHANLDEPY